jgi:hypothetical protein
LFENFTDEGNEYGFFQHDAAIVRTRALCPARSPDLMTRDYQLRRSFEGQRLKQQQRARIERRTVSAICREEFHKVLLTF